VHGTRNTPGQRRHRPARAVAGAHPPRRAARGRV